MNWGIVYLHSPSHTSDPCAGTMPPSVRPKRYICQHDGCGKAYTRPSLLQQHERTHSNERPFKCTVKGCDKAFFRKSHLDVHGFSHKENDEMPFTCDVCGKGFHAQQRLNSHMLTHTKRFACTFDGCTEKFYAYPSLAHHINVIHKLVLTCDVCNKRFALRRLVARHKQKWHAEVSGHQCVHTGCFQLFATDELLQKHMAESHARVSCVECGEKVQQQDLNAHAKAHAACGDASILRKSLTLKDLLIEDEDQQFNLHDNDEVKRVTTSEMYNKKTFECVCGKTFKRKFYYERHLKTHEGAHDATLPAYKSIISVVLTQQKPRFHCKCGRTFERLHFYQKHVKRHELRAQQAEEALKAMRPDEESDFDYKDIVDISDDDLPTPEPSRSNSIAV